MSVYVEFSKPRTPSIISIITSPSDTVALIIADYGVRAKLSRGKTARGLLGRTPAIIVRRMITGVYFVFDRNPTASFSRRLFSFQDTRGSANVYRIESLAANKVSSVIMPMQTEMKRYTER